MKRKLLFADIVLWTLVAAGAFNLRREWIEVRTREQAMLQKSIQPVFPPPIVRPTAAEPVRAVSYRDIAEKMLFSKDRNATVVSEPPAPPILNPMPALPLLHGVLDLGDGPIAIMSEGPKGSHRDYQAGDRIGPFRLVAVDREHLVLEWQGRTITRRVDDIIGRSHSQSPHAQAIAAAPAIAR